MSISGYPTPASLVITKRLADSPYLTGPADGLVLVDCLSGSVTIIINTAVGNHNWGRDITVKKIDSSTNPVIITPVSGQTIDSMTQVNILSRNRSMTMASDGFNWWIK